MSRPQPYEFLPLPYYPWTSRPKSIPLDQDEAATALYLNHGDIRAAAARLKVTVSRLMKTVRKSPRLLRLLSDGRASADECRAATGSQARR